MEVSESLQAMSTVESLYDGTPRSAEIVAYLATELLKRPESFWQVFYETVDENNYNPVRVEAERLIDSGRITPDSTFEDMRLVVAEANSIKGEHAY